MTDWCRRAGGCGYVAGKIPDYQRSILLGEVVMATSLFKSNIYSMVGPACAGRMLLRHGV